MGIMGLCGPLSGSKLLVELWLPYVSHTPIIYLRILRLQCLSSSPLLHQSTFSTSSSHATYPPTL